MSCSDVLCRTCDSRLGLEDAVFGEIGKALARCAPEMTALAQALSAANSASTYDSQLGLTLVNIFQPVDLSWFAAHAGHEIIPCDHHGVADDECGVQFECCTDCDSKHLCRLPRNHVTGHSARRGA